MKTDDGGRWNIVVVDNTYNRDAWLCFTEKTYKKVFIKLFLYTSLYSPDAVIVWYI